MSLKTYEEKRNFDNTPEPAPQQERSAGDPIFVIQEHHAASLHYDLRLEADGVLKSWAVSKEPTLDPLVRRLAVQLEDHPLAYAAFKGDIPDGYHGAGRVELWDQGTFRNLRDGGPEPMTIAESIEAGHVAIDLHGERLHGAFTLMRMKAGGGRHWLLIKKNDVEARPGTAGESADGATKPGRDGA